MILCLLAFFFSVVGIDLIFQNENALFEQNTERLQKFRNVPLKFLILRYLE